MTNELQNVLDEIKLEKDSKLLPENIKKGVQIFDITGTLEQGGASTDAPVKLFTTVEEMQSDTNVEEHDLAIIYKENSRYADVDVPIYKLYVPYTITLSTALTAASSIMLRDKDDDMMLRLEIRPNSVYYNGYIRGGQFMVYYESSDGKVFTRSDVFVEAESIKYEDDILTFPAPLYITDGTVKDVIKPFLTISRHDFDGIYAAKETDNTASIRVLKDWNYNRTTSEFTTEYEDVMVGESILEEIKNAFTGIDGYSGIVKINFENDIPVSADAYSVSNHHLVGYKPDNTQRLILYSYNSTTTKTYTVTHYDIATKTTSTTTGTTTKYTETYNSTTYNLHVVTTLNNSIWFSISFDDGNFGTDGRGEFLIYATPNGSQLRPLVGYSRNIYKYFPADTQFTLNNVNQLTKGITALGDIPYTGDGSIWSTMADEDFRAMVYDTNSDNDSELLSGLIKFSGIPDTFNPKTIYGLDYDLSEDITADYVYDQLMLRRDIISSGEAPITSPGSSYYAARHMYSVSKDEIYLFYGSGSSTPLSVYKYHMADDKTLVFDYTVTSAITVVTFSYQQPVCRYKDGVIYMVCTTGTESSGTASPSLITFDTSTKKFTTVRTCATKALSNGIIDYDVDTQLCYFHSGTNLYKWKTSSTFATSIASDTFRVTYSSSSDGVVEYVDSKYFAILGKNYIRIVNRATGAVSSITDSSGNYYTALPRGRFIEIGNYMYVFSYDYSGSTRYIYAAKIDLTTMTLVKSTKPSSGTGIRMRGKSKNSMFMLEDDPTHLYVMVSASYITNTGGNNTGSLMRVDLDSLEVESTNTKLGSNCGVIIGLEQHDTTYIVPKHNFERFDFYEYGYSQNVYQFILANITDFAHNDIPFIVADSYGYTNPNNYNNMIQSFMNEIAYDTAINTVDEILGEDV